MLEKIDWVGISPALFYSSWNKSRALEICVLYSLFPVFYFTNHYLLFTISNLCNHHFYSPPYPLSSPAHMNIYYHHIMHTHSQPRFCLLLLACHCIARHSLVKIATTIIPHSSCSSYRIRQAYHTTFVNPHFCQSAGNQPLRKFPIFPTLPKRLIFPTLPQKYFRKTAFFWITLCA